jgi:methylated-DNA-protein-cysteine methyltransferase-like protein
VTSADDAAARERRIIDVLMALGEGEVTTYGDVAATAGYPKQARLVGRILATAEVELPWWRVVAAGGLLRAGDRDLQTQLLRAEDVVVRNGRVREAPVGRFKA